MKKRIAIYTRVSTGYQVDKDSLPYQRQECTNYAKLILHASDTDIEIYEDAGKSGKNTTGRPAFGRMMDDIRKGEIGKVIVLKIDRISRNLVDFSIMYETFREYGVSFISLNEQFDTGSAMGEAMLKIILVFAELERKMTSERVTSVMIGRAKAGEWNGARVPFGWAWDSGRMRPVHHPTEGPMVIQMYDLYLQHRSSCWLRDFLNANDIPTKRGGEWTSKTVADIIRNPLNKGDYRYNYRHSARGKKKAPEDVIYVEGLYEPLVSPEKWNECNRIMDGNAAGRSTKGYPKHQQYPHVFANLIYCNQCGYKFIISRLDKSRKNGFQPTTYICSRRYRKIHCNAQMASDVVLGPFVINYIAAIARAADDPGRFETAAELEKYLLDGPAFSDVAGIASKGLNEMFLLLTFRLSAEWAAAAVESNGPEGKPKEAELQAQIDRCARAMERLNRAYLFSDGAMSEKEFLELRSNIEQERVDATNKLKEMRVSALTEISDETAFFRSASGFLLSLNVNGADFIQYDQLAPLVEPEVLQGFFRSVISRIYVEGGKVMKIVFRNGIEHEFLYR